VAVDAWLSGVAAMALWLGVGARRIRRRIAASRVDELPPPAVAEALWAAVHAGAHSMRAIALKVEPEWLDGDTAAHARLRAWGFTPGGETVQPRRTIVVDIGGSEDEILARMKPKWRYNIRLSARKGVVVEENGPEEIGPFYELMVVTGQRDGFGVHSRAYYQRAYDLFAPLGRARLFLARYEGAPLGGLMAFAFNGTAYYMYGASSNAHRELMPNHQLQWRAMQWARAQGCRRYDFWGITDVEGDLASAALSGVERFKAGFGGRVVRTVGAYDHVYRPLLHRLLQFAWARRRAHGAAGAVPEATPAESTPED
jgi:peptidoglycan pentaglycine glycine transferase (the first glycine)